LEEQYHLPSRTRASIKACVDYSEDRNLSARCWKSVDAVICGPNRRRLTPFIAIPSLLLVAAFIGCGGGSNFLPTRSQQSPTAPGQFETSTDDLDFGTVIVGQIGKSSVTLVNQGSTAVQISDLSVNGNDFAVANSGSPSSSIAPNGGTYTIALQYSPKAEGASAGILTVTSTSFTSPSVKVKLHGKGTSTTQSGSPTLSSITCAQNSITGSASNSCTVTLDSAAGSSGLAINLASDNGAVIVPASVIVPSGATSIGFPISINAVSTPQTATLTASAGGVSKSLSLQLNTSGSSSSVPTLSLNATSLSFGSVVVNTPATQNITLSSTGAAALIVNSAAVTGAGFSVSGIPFPVTLNPGQSANLTVQFDPNVSGAASGQITVTSNSSTNSTATVGLSGTGMVVPSTLACSNSSMTGAGTDTCTVTLDGAAPNGGMSVSLTSSNAAVIVPASVTIAAGSASASFPATVSAVSTTQTATLTAMAGGVSKSFGIQLNASASQPTLSGISCTAPSITGAGTDSCIVTLSSAAPSGGMGVSLSSSNAAVAVPASVMVATGSASASFAATVSAVSTTQTATLTAMAGGVSKSFGIQLNASASQPTLSGISCTAPSMTGAGTDSCTVTLSAAAPSGGMGVSLSSDNAAVTIPASVTVAAGSASASFAATVSTVSTTQSATLTAAADGVSKSFGIQLNASQVTLSGVSCTASSMTGSGTDACTVTLSGPAVSSGVTVSLSSSNAAVTVPASVTVPVGAASIGFSAAVSSVVTAQSATLTATASAVSKTFAIQLKASVPTLNINASTVSFGDINLNTTATQTITLSSSGTAAVTVNTATIVGTGFSLPGLALPVTLNPGQTASLSVAFKPTTAGAATGNLTIVSTSSTSPSAVVTLSGNGVAIAYQVTLNWNAPTTSSDPVAGYNVYRAATGTGTYQKLNTSPLTATNYVDTQVKSAQSYDYVVKSVDASGVESAPTNTTTAVIP
jgi:hypothetical protein